MHHPNERCKAENLSVCKINHADDEDIPSMKMKKFEVSKETEGLQHNSSETTVEISYHSDILKNQQ